MYKIIVPGNVYEIHSFFSVVVAWLPKDLQLFRIEERKENIKYKNKSEQMKWTNGL
jgi:hypothetical protein